MNTGIISERYAQALLKFVTETGGGDKVYAQAKLLEKCFATLEDMRLMILLPKATSDSFKVKVLVTALGGKENAAPELVRFVQLVMRNHRTKYLRLMLLIFMDLYRKANNISFGRRVMAVPSDALKRKLTDIVHDETGGTLELETKVDPSIIGGFIFDMEGRRLDASVASQLKTVRTQFIEKNRRIV